MTPKTEKTLVLIKPDALQRGLVGEVIKRFEQKGLKIIGLKMMQLQEAILQEHYAHVVDKPFFEELSQFMSSSPVIIMALEGLNSVEIVRHIAGVSDKERGSLRGDFSLSNQKNIVHTSDSPQTAAKEIERFFQDGELFQYSKDEWKYVYAKSDETPSK